MQDDTTSRDYKIFEKIKLKLKELNFVTNVLTDLYQLQFTYKDIEFKITVADKLMTDGMTKIVVYVDIIGYDDKLLNYKRNLWLATFNSKPYSLFEKLNDLLDLLPQVEENAKFQKLIRSHLVKKFTEYDLGVEVKSIKMGANYVWEVRVNYWETGFKAMTRAKTVIYFDKLNQIIYMTGSIHMSLTYWLEKKFKHNIQ